MIIYLIYINLAAFLENNPVAPVAGLNASKVNEQESIIKNNNKSKKSQKNQKSKKW